MTQIKNKCTPNFTEPENLTHEFFTMGDGRRIHVATVGSGDPLVFVHGWPEFWLTWMPVVNKLKDEFKCIMPCLYGFGLSDKPDILRDDLDAAFHANDIMQTVEKMCDKPPVLIGHDIGSYVLQCCATQEMRSGNGSHLAGLIFFNCPTPSVGKEWVSQGHINKIWYQSFHLTQLAVDLVGYNRETIEIYLRHFLNHWSYSEEAFELFLPKLLEVFRSEGALYGGFSWYKSNNLSRLETIAGPKRSHIPKINMPSAVLWGRHDPILKSDWACHLQSNFENVTIEFAEESGHFVHFEQPELAADFVRDRLKIWRQRSD
mgnify:FL=1